MQTSIPANINKPVCLRSDAGSTILTELNRNVLIDVEDAIRNLGELGNRGMADTDRVILDMMVCR